jgi:hypothetical protein
MITIDKNTWHYKTFAWTYRFWDSEYKIRDGHSNLCTYVQRLLWVLPFSIFLVAFLSLLYIISIPFAWLFGGLPYNIWEDSPHSAPWRSYPGFKVWGEVRLHPWVVAVPVAIIYGEWAWFHYAGWIRPVCIQGFLLAVVGMLAFFFWFKETNKTNLISEWFSAKKAGICPLVEFRDPDQK